MNILNQCTPKSWYFLSFFFSPHPPFFQLAWDISVAFTMYLLCALSFIHPSMLYTLPILSKAGSVFWDVKWNTQTVFWISFCSKMVFAVPWKIRLWSSPFSFYHCCFLAFSLFNIFPKFQVIALDFVLILHNHDDHQLHYDWLGFRHRQSMQLPGTTGCQITTVGEDRNQLFEHHEHPNSKSQLMLLRQS